MVRETTRSDDDEEPSALETATRLERLGRLLRQAGHSGGLVPAQWEILRYLGRANRLSRSPGSIARYLGNTKGTTSQSISSLQKKGLVSRQVSTQDERHVLLRLTESGQAKLASDPLQMLTASLEALGGKTRRRFSRGLAELLDQELNRQNAARFGTCAGCLHCHVTAGSKDLVCGVDGARLPPEERALLCSVFAAG